MRIVLIGGSGFIGTNVAVYLRSRGYDVLVLDRKPADGDVLKKSGIDFKECDYISGNGIGSNIEEGDCVIHLVSTSLPNQSNTEIIEDVKNNIISSLNLFEMCISKKVSKIIFASSGGQVYGIPDYTPIDERHATNPKSAYGIQKLAIEKYLQLYGNLYGMCVRIMRISNPYGPGQQPFRGQGVISTFLASAFMDRSIEIWGNGDSVRDYIYIDDLARSFERMIEYQGEEQVFNIGSGEGASVNDILNGVERVSGKHISRVYIGAKTADVSTNILNCKKAKDELNWEMEVNLQEGIRKMSLHWDFDANRFVIRN